MGRGRIIKDLATMLQRIDFISRVKGSHLKK